MGAAAQDLANRMPASLVRRELPRVDRVFVAWNRDAAARTQLDRAEHLARFGVFAFKERDARRACARLLALGKDDATAAIVAWDYAMQRAGLSEDTRERRISNVRSFTRVAQEIGACAWRLTIGATREPAEVPSVGEVEHAIAELERRERRRDLAIVLLAYDAQLAIGEIIALRVGDVDFGDGSVTTTKRRVTLTPRTVAALRDAIDGDDHDPLFTGTRGGELSPITAWRIFRGLGLGSPDCVRKAGLEARDGG